VQLPADTSLTGAAVRRMGKAAQWRWLRLLRKLRAEAVVRLMGDRLGPQMAASRVPVDAEVVVYFPDLPDRLYQLDQWLPVLDKLAKRRRLLIVTREMQTMSALESRTQLPTVCVASFLDLMGLYDLGEFKVGIYVNNSNRNFQSLNNPRMLHVHVNHGESDKLSSFSNQVKGYDRVFVAGPVAAERYREALIDFDERRLVQVGRPQLDLDFADVLPASTRRTVMYAPTWEGESESNNWTSLDRFGVDIVEAALATADVRLVYKPHPRVSSSHHPGVSRAHKKIVRRIESANSQDPQAGHVVDLKGNILAMFAATDVMVGDISSVTLDFLYLRPECPIFLTDRRDDRDLLIADSPLAEGADVIDSATVGGFAALLGARLADDSRREDRLRTRKHYFGDLPAGASTTRFLEAVDELIETRDRLLAGHRRVTTGDVDEHG
jgi:hypothetical protein